MIMIGDLEDLIRKHLAVDDLHERVTRVNRLREVISECSPFRDEPVDHVESAENAAVDVTGSITMRNRNEITDRNGPPLGADDRTPRSSLGLCEGVGCHDRCKGCGHERWEHDPDGCLHSDQLGDYGEYSDDCVCVLPITDVPYGTHSREHYDYTVGNP